MDGKNPFEQELAVKIGRIEECVENLVKTNERTLDNIEETFRRLGKVETVSACNETEIGSLKENVKDMKTKSGVISGITATIIAGIVEVIRVLTGSK